MRCLLLLGPLALLSLGTSSAAPEKAAAEALVARLEAHHRSVAELTARFVQSYRSGVLGREIVESGTLAIKRPGRMRWEYREPESKLFVATGEAFYFYVPEDRQVIVQQQAGDKRAPALLLAGDTRLLEQFEAELLPAPEGRQRLLLTPREPDPDLTRLLVELDAALRVRALEVSDALGGETSFRFDEIRENPGLGERLFRFEVPDGVEVITG